MKRRHLILLLVPALALALGACSSAVTPGKLQRVSGGMKTDQVTKLLGPPSRIEHSEITGLTGDVYHYDSDQGDAVVVFINGAVFKTNFIRGAKSS